MPGYSIRQRLVGIKALTQAGWIDGILHAPFERRLLDYLDITRDYLAFTEVTIAAQEQMPFLALQRNAIIFMVVKDLEQIEHEAQIGEHDEHRVTCLLRNGSLTGTIRTTRNIRLSDHLSKAKSLVQVSYCRYHVWDPWSREIIDGRERLIFVNHNEIIGVSEI